MKEYFYIKILMDKPTNLEPREYQDYINKTLREEIFLECADGGPPMFVTPDEKEGIAKLQIALDTLQAKEPDKGHKCWLLDTVLPDPTHPDYDEYLEALLAWRNGTEKPAIADGLST